MLAQVNSSQKLLMKKDKRVGKSDVNSISDSHQKFRVKRRGDLTSNSDSNSQLAHTGLIMLQNSSSGKTPTPQHQSSKLADDNQPKTLQQLYGNQ